MRKTVRTEAGRHNRKNPSGAAGVRYGADKYDGLIPVKGQRMERSHDIKAKVDPGNNSQFL